MDGLRDDIEIFTKNSLTNACVLVAEKCNFKLLAFKSKQFIIK